jgi:hypothetical protein
MSRINYYEECSTYIYRKIRQAAGYSDEKWEPFYESRRLGHCSKTPKPCTELGPGDMFDCYYLFGETILHTIHAFGECPYLRGDK